MEFGPGRSPSRKPSRPRRWRRFSTLAARLDLFILGTGRDWWQVPPACATLFSAHSLRWEAMPTNAAIRTYNVLVAEGRRVAAGSIAVG